MLGVFGLIVQKIYVGTTLQETALRRVLHHFQGDENEIGIKAKEHIRVSASSTVWYTKLKPRSINWREELTETVSSPSLSDMCFNIVNKWFL